MARNDTDSSGCGCLILIALAIGFFINQCDRDSTPKESSSSAIYQSSEVDDIVEEYVEEESVYDEGVQEAVEEEKLSADVEKYLTNSLPTGATPYKKFYGKNYKCPSYQCSAIIVTAPRESDIVVIIKRNNSEGKVISHGYIKASHTCRFDIPDGTYQTFFYYGRGWNPNKEMKGGVKGGFVKDEIFSKDYPQLIESAELSYVLQLQRSGNFQTKGSNKNEMF